MEMTPELESWLGPGVLIKAVCHAVDEIKTYYGVLQHFGPYRMITEKDAMWAEWFKDPDEALLATKEEHAWSYIAVSEADELLFSTGKKPLMWFAPTIRLPRTTPEPEKLPLRKILIKGTKEEEDCQTIAEYW